MTRLYELAAEVAALLLPEVTAPGAPARSNNTNAVVTAFRPYLAAALTGAQPKALRTADDQRFRLWRISMEWWHGEEVVARSDGRGAEGSDGGDIVTGLDGAAALVAGYAAELGLPPATYGLEPMRRAFNNLRPSLTRGNGHATMRRSTLDGGVSLICDVFREEPK